MKNTKKLTALLLALVLLLMGCAVGADGKVATDDLAVGKAAEPDLPEAPSEAAFEAAVSKLDAEKLGDEKYSIEWNKLWDEYYEKQNAYDAALKALRGDGIDPSYTRGFADYTRATATALLTGGTDTVVYSPANLYLALAMLTETADGNSRAQLLSLLQQESVDDVRTAASALWRNLYEDDDCGVTSLSNSVWLNSGVPFAQSTVDTLAQEYYASTFSVPMGEEKTDKAIQSWMNEATGGLLDDAVKSVETDGDTAMLLLSALYFQSRWNSEFFEGNTREATFTNADGSQTQIDFMHQTHENTTCLLGEGYTVAKRYFMDGKRMTFLLPDEGVALDDVLTSDGAVAALLGLVEDNTEADVVWSVPKFDVTSDLDLGEALQKLGVADVFDAERADFSPLTGEESALFVGKVQHTTRVAIDEEGCVAAALTQIFLCGAGLPEEKPIVNMTLDRPFAFVISGADGLPLFFAAVKSVA